MELKIGDIKQVDGEWYQCCKLGKLDLQCDNCDLFAKDCHSKIGHCFYEYRHDNKNVVFKKLEKVGKPFERNGYMYQEYKTHTYPLLMSGDAKIPTANGFAVIIKQNKDMEEKKLNLKPFNLEAAKSGKPVCTRDGRKVRIICFDRVTNSTNEYTGHLIVLVTNPNGDEQSFYYTEKGNLAGEDEYDNLKWDLMMLPEKKEGWINIYPNELKIKSCLAVSGEKVYPTKELAEYHALHDCIATVPVEWEE